MNRFTNWIKSLIEGDDSDYYYDSNGNRKPKTYGRGGFTKSHVALGVVLMAAVSFVMFVLWLFGIDVFNK